MYDFQNVKNESLNLLEVCMYVHVNFCFNLKIESQERRRKESCLQKISRQVKGATFT